MYLDVERVRGSGKRVGKGVMKTELQNIFLYLVRLGIQTGRPIYQVMESDIDWELMQALAKGQGLAAVVVDGVEQLPLDQRPPKRVLLQWIGEVLQGYEYRYELYRRAVAEMASFYNSHGYKMMVLKGFACSLDWPKPEHRPCGDIDIWLFGKQKEADAVLSKEKGIGIDNGHHHHTMFYWRDFMVENHYDFVNVYAHKSSRELEKLFKRLGEDDTHTTELYGEAVYLPPANLNALFLIRHLLIHFVSNEITLRQLIDWGFFVKNHTMEVDWKWILEILDEYHMRDFVNCINAICVEDLGFEACYFPIVQFEPSLKARVLNDILLPKSTGDSSRGVFSRLINKCRRWKANGWKHELCYNESRWESFWASVWAHILKPSSI